MASESVRNWNQQVIDEFRANDGKVGGPFAGANMVLLHHKGRKSGAVHVNPLVYQRDGERLLIFASKGGFPTHPEWYLNLLANPDAEVEVGTEKYAVTAEDLKGEERDRFFAKQVAEVPVFGEYQQKTGRTIPVVALTRKD